LFSRNAVDAFLHFINHCFAAVHWDNKNVSLVVGKHDSHVSFPSRWWLVAFCVFDAFAKISLEAMANRSPVFLVIGAAVVAAVVDLAVVGVFHGYVLSLMLLAS